MRHDEAELTLHEQVMPAAVTAITITAAAVRAQHVQLLQLPFERVQVSPQCVNVNASTRCAAGLQTHELDRDDD